MNQAAWNISAANSQFGAVWHHFGALRYLSHCISLEKAALEATFTSRTASFVIPALPHPLSETYSQINLPSAPRWSGS